MRKYRIIASAALLVVLLFIVGRSCIQRGEKVLRADSRDLKHTVITAHLEEKIVPGKNLIYCSTFQLAWNELRDNIIGEDIRLTDEPPMVKILNKKLTTKAEISQNCYVAMAGFGKDDIVNKINRALKSKFGSDAPTVTARLNPESIYAYGFLLKSLRFPTPFEKLKKPLSFRSPSGPVDVSVFGIKEHSPRTRARVKMAKQVSILAYDYSTDECVLSLVSKSPKDEIIVARVRPGETLLQTIRSVSGMIQNSKPASLNADDSFQIPKLDFDIKHSYEELIGKTLLNEAFAGYYVYRARQDIRFRLNERGATLKSQAEIQFEAEGMHNLLFNEPFLLYLKEKTGKYPYLAIWVDNPEILLKH